MGNYETHDLAPVRDDERKELNLSRKITYKQYCKHIKGIFHEGCLTEIPWNIRDSISLYERMTVAFNAVPEIPPEMPLRLPHLHTIDLSHNVLETLPESFGLQFHLRTLILRNNRLKSLPESFVHLVKLEKIDLSNNLLKELPQDIGNMEAIQKLNVSGNKLRQLPLSLGASTTLVLLMAQQNRLYEPPQAICDEGSDVTLSFLRKLYKNSKPLHEKRPLTPLNEFPRVRGNQLHSAVPNPHSANMQYIQSQTHTTNTPSRIKTPLLPPLGASSLESDVLKDKVIGLLYGAAIGDALGLATRGMSRDECSFYYDTDDIDYTQILQDRQRVLWRAGDWTSNFDSMLLVLDSILAWAGVVDELDFAKRLKEWSERGYPELGDTEGIVLSQTIKKLIGEKDFTENPHSVATRVYLQELNTTASEQNGYIVSEDERSSISSISSSISSISSDRSPRKHLLHSVSSESEFCVGCDQPCVDNGAIVRTAILGVPNFFDLTEVQNNTLRICNSTHPSPLSQAACCVISVIIACMLQGKNEMQTCKEIEEIITIARDQGRKLLVTTEEKADFEYYCSLQDIDRLDVNEYGKSSYCMKPLGAALISLRSRESFKDCMMKMILAAGDSNSNCCVAGAVLGSKVGFSRLPKHWVHGLRKKQTAWLNVKVNLLLDMIGLP
ncbi:uncharacterized protein LOC133187526 [Saccostrea echinata]|uniref:uncharacterized protein LOC133187526 n=1 Tax=Saccostrea echinata TaxID=191078 RepID=UPI002A815EB8|nr:uncharacterized protein LOC133187526 [Saccostrea echinata]XP_061178914.1 uncharacterized protein LOC133187526 [Saccostrea echinata]